MKIKRWRWIQEKMKYLLNKLQETFSRKKLRSQLYLVYTIAFFIPMACIGTFLVFNTSRLLSNYYSDLNEANNMRAKTVLFEITTRIYNLSEDIVFDDALQDLLSEKYGTQEDYIKSAAKYKVLEDYLDSYTELDDIIIYSDNPYVSDFEEFKYVGEEVASSSWYQKAQHQSSAFWATITQEDKYGNIYYNLCLIRKIPLLASEDHAVLVIKINENYLKSRLNTKEYEMLVYSDIGGLFYSSNRLWYNSDKIINIDYDVNYYQYDGQIVVENKKYMTSVSTLKLYQTDNRIYVCNMDFSAYKNMNLILTLCLSIIIVAMVLPFLLIRFFTVHFSERVDTLREAMHKASNENYDVPAKLMGEDEISQAFADLQKMVVKIKVKDAKMYEERINAQKILNAQQRIEMKMLASQINPHFLYNTLETIRMKAFIAGDKEVANAIKLLGKSMRYVLENTGTSSTTLKNELDYIETYLQIQKLRFADRVNYVIEIEEGLNTSEHEILPLLIQPIVENAVGHGLEEAGDNGQIMINIYTKKNEILHIDISDNGCGMSSETLAALRTKIETPNLNPNRSIGLYNINQRIRLCYGEQYGLIVDSSPNKGTKVSLILPLTINMETVFTTNA